MRTDAEYSFLFNTGRWPEYGPRYPIDRQGHPFLYLHPAQEAFMGAELRAAGWTIVVMKPIPIEGSKLGSPRAKSGSIDKGRNPKRTR